MVLSSKNGMCRRMAWLEMISARNESPDKNDKDWCEIGLGRKDKRFSGWEQGKMSSLYLLWEFNEKFGKILVVWSFWHCAKSATRRPSLWDQKSSFGIEGKSKGMDEWWNNGNTRTKSSWEQEWNCSCGTICEQPRHVTMHKNWVISRMYPNIYACSDTSLGHTEIHRGGHWTTLKDMYCWVNMGDKHSFMPDL